MRPLAAPREIKNLLYEQVARIGRAVASPKRLELIELLCQGEKSVEILAQQADLGVKSASAHLEKLKAVRVVCTRKEGKHVHYRLAEQDIASFWVVRRNLAERRLPELPQLENVFLSDPQHVSRSDRRDVLCRARQGEVVVIDLRPAPEFEAGRLPFARSIPIPAVSTRLTRCTGRIAACARGK